MKHIKKSSVYVLSHIGAEKHSKILRDNLNTIMYYIVPMIVPFQSGSNTLAN